MLAKTHHDRPVFVEFVLQRSGQEVPMKRDPVCGMEVDEARAPAKATYKGETFYFCSDDCRDQFLRNPDAYVAPAATARTTT